MVKVGGDFVNAYVPGKFIQQKKERIEKNNQGISYSHQYDFDIDFINYVKETVPQTVHEVSYFRDLCKKSANYLSAIRQSKNNCGFEDFIMADGNAYSDMYNNIVKGYRDGTRKRYVYDNSANGERRLLTVDEELEKLNKGFDELIAWNKANARIAASPVYRTEKQKKQQEKWNEVFDQYDENQVCDYIQDTYLEFRLQYQQEYEKRGENVDIKTILFSILHGDDQGIHNYCEWLFLNENVVTK